MLTVGSVPQLVPLQSYTGVGRDRVLRSMRVMPVDPGVVGRLALITPHQAAGAQVLVHLLVGEDRLTNQALIEPINQLTATPCKQFLKTITQFRMALQTQA